MKYPHTQGSIRPETSVERLQRLRDQLSGQMAIVAYRRAEALSHPDPEERAKMLLGIDERVNPGHQPHVGPPRRLISA